MCCRCSCNEGGSIGGLLATVAVVAGGIWTWANWAAIMAGVAAFLMLVKIVAISLVVISVLTIVGIVAIPAYMRHRARTRAFPVEIRREQIQVVPFPGQDQQVQFSTGSFELTEGSYARSVNFGPRSKVRSRLDG